MAQPNQDKRGILLKNATSPFYDSARPQGDVNAPASGGTAQFAYSAPNGIQDGKSITITTNLHTFVTPEKFNWLGHGKGWLYDTADGLPFENVEITTPLGLQRWEYEDAPGSERRFVATINGRKYLRSLLRPPNNLNLKGCGTINWDAGRALGPGDFTYMFSSGKISVGSGSLSALQLKDERIGAYKNLPSGATDSDNSVYIKHYDSNNPILDPIIGNVSKPCYYAKGLSKNQAYSQGWVWKQNTPDVPDGYNIVQAVQEGNPGYICEEPFRTSESIYPRAVIRSTSAERPKWLKWQGFAGNTQPDHLNIEWLKTDLFAQLNGSIFILADAAVLASATNFHPLVPISFNSNKSWTLSLWKGMLPNYSNAHVHLLDSRLASVANVKL